MSDKIKPSDLFEKVPPCVEKHLSCVEYPWEIIPKIKDIVASYDLGGYTEITDGVYVGKNVKISNLATVVPPAIIGDDTEIRPGAYLRGNVIIGKGRRVAKVDVEDNAHRTTNYSNESATICQNLKSDTIFIFD